MSDYSADSVIISNNVTPHRTLGDGVEPSLGETSHNQTASASEVNVSTPLLGGSFENLTVASARYRRSSLQSGDSPLGVMAVCAITYFNVCGGPWGTESIIGAAGPLPGLIGAIILALGWGLPLSLVTAELSSVFPDDGGYSIWVSEAFGEFWGFQESYWSWVSGVIDNALYPVLSYEVLVKLVKGSISEYENESYFDRMTAYMIKFGIVCLFTLPNLFTVRDFGPGLTILACFSFLPFVVLSFHTLFFEYDSLEVMNLFEVKEGAKIADWWTLINTLYWNFSGFDCVSTCAGNVKSPSKTYPKGLLIALFLITFSYLLPLSSSVLLNEPDWNTWSEGSYVTIAEFQVGRWLAICMVVASFAGNAGMHAAEMFEDSWQLCGMAEVGLAPSVFAYKHPKFNTPWVAIAFSFAIISGLIVYDFQFVVTISNFFSVASALLELCAFYKLRCSKKTLFRPFRVPVRSCCGLILFLAFPVCVGIVVLFSSMGNTVYTLSINFGAILFGMFLYSAMKHFGNLHYARLS